MKMNVSRLLECGKYIEERTNEYLNDMEQFCNRHKDEMLKIGFSMVIGISTVADNEFKDGLTLGQGMGDASKFNEVIHKLIANIEKED